MPQIHLEQISKVYHIEKKAIAAIHDINLTIGQGEFVFVTGSSGAGKTTLLQIIAGLTEPTSGRLYFTQRTAAALPKQRKYKSARIGYAPQISQLIRRRTIRENLEMAAMVGRWKRQAAVQARIQKSLQMVGLRGTEDRYPAELSLGECRRVELARAMINSPPILVLDEVTANLDEDTSWDILHLLCEMNRRGTTVIMATHARQFVNLLRKRVITLVDGTVFGDVQKGRYGDVV